jgi:hypothetical protein
VLAITRTLFEDNDSQIALLPCGNRSNIIRRARVAWARDRTHFGAVKQVKGHNSAATSGRDPAQNKHVRVEERLAALPAIGLRCMHIEIPQKSDAKRLL